jgi:hypothetical protein
MAQNLRLSEYLSQRGKKAKALTRIEAEVFGIEYPLQAGWPRRHGGMEITGAMIDLVQAHAVEAGMSTDRQVRRSAKRATAALPTQVPDQRPVLAEKVMRPSLFPGFVVRPALRHRTRRPAPWA